MNWIKKIIKLQSFWFILFWIAFLIWGKIDNDSLMILSVIWLVVMIIVFIRDLLKS